MAHIYVFFFKFLFRRDYFTGHAGGKISMHRELRIKCETIIQSVCLKMFRGIVVICKPQTRPVKSWRLYHFLSKKLSKFFVFQLVRMWL